MCVLMLARSLTNPNQTIVTKIMPLEDHDAITTCIARIYLFLDDFRRTTTYARKSIVAVTNISILFFISIVCDYFFIQPTDFVGYFSALHFEGDHWHYSGYETRELLLSKHFRSIG